MSRGILPGTWTGSRRALSRAGSSPFPVPHADGPITTLTPAMHLAMKQAVGAFFGLPPREKDLLDREHLQAWLGRP